MFYPPELIERARRNIAEHDWAAEMQRKAVADAAPWMAMGDEELWDLMFGPTITRSWMVLSYGGCPACKGSVPMYEWKIDALAQPWKLRCPHCGELFPKNDFAAFYRSGLDQQGIFREERADKALLFNTEHPDPADPLHLFGVDGGHGYPEGDERWLFIGTYLVYGQWKQLVVGGIRALAVAHVLTGQDAYAHKAGVLLDRVADLYPTFDFGTQAILYEQEAASGYVSTWHDACEETRGLVLAYDQVREALARDEELVEFLSAKAREIGLENPKASWDDVRRNIEDRILQDALDSFDKIHSNYPRTPICQMVIKCVLGWPGGRDEVMAQLDEVMAKATAVDGVTGEKGLPGYASFVIKGLAGFLALFARVEKGLLEDLLRRYPRLHDMYRFHIDTWCLGRYYPSCGDAIAFARPVEQYCGVSPGKESLLAPSMHQFLFDLYRATGDEALVKVLYHTNDESVEGLPDDVFCEDPAAFRSAVQEVVDRSGPEIQLGSVNKEQWCLGILRSGHGERARAAWLDYDAMRGHHAHCDGMNLGLFALGLDLMPDLGYPPVQYRGWSSARAQWYYMSASHNTVLVDGKEQEITWREPLSGRCTLWAEGEFAQAIRASCPEMVGGQQYERTIVQVDVSERDFYLVDLFRVIGGSDHAKFMHSHFGAVNADGLSLAPGEDYAPDVQMRNFRCDPGPAPGWSVDWRIEDRYELLPSARDLHLRYTDLTTGAEAWLCEMWVCVGGYSSGQEAWVPRAMVRRRGEEPLATTFVGLIEPYEGERVVSAVRRLPLATPDGAPCPDANVALEVTLADGRRDLIVAADVENPLGLAPHFGEGARMVAEGWGPCPAGELSVTRVDAGGKVGISALWAGRPGSDAPKP